MQGSIPKAFVDSIVMVKCGWSWLPWGSVYNTDVRGKWLEKSNRKIILHHDTETTYVFNWIFSKDRQDAPAFYLSYWRFSARIRIERRVNWRKGLLFSTVCIGKLVHGVSISSTVGALTLEWPENSSFVLLCHFVIVSFSFKVYWSTYTYTHTHVYMDQFIFLLLCIF